MKKLFVWELEDTVVEYGLAIGFAESTEEAIALICASVSDPILREELQEELQYIEPKIHTQSYGFFSESPT